MNVRHTTFAIATTLVAAFALAPFAEARTRPGVDTAYTSDDEGQFDPDSSLQAAVLDSDALESMEVLSASDDEIIMVWATVTGCEFELSFTPGSDIQVLLGEDETCDFDAWVENNTTYVEATEVVSVWESTGWFEFFAYLAGESGAPGGDGQGSDAAEGGDYKSSEQREDLDDCSKAIAYAALGAIGCGGGIAVAVGSTGASGGLLWGSVALAVAGCGFFAMGVVDVTEECGESWRQMLALDYLQWQDFLDVTQVEDLCTYTEVQDFTVFHDQAETLAGEWWMDGNVQELVSLTTGLHDEITTCQ